MYYLIARGGIATFRTGGIIDVQSPGQWVGAASKAGATRSALERDIVRANLSARAPVFGAFNSFTRGRVAGDLEFITA
jgi:hypothetical protein